MHRLRLGSPSMTLRILRYLMSSLSVSASDGSAARCAEVRNGFDRTHPPSAAPMRPLKDAFYAHCLILYSLYARTR